MNNGFFRVAAVVPAVKVADCEFNANEIITKAHEAAAQGAQLIAFPELAVTSYSCGDLFKNNLLLEQSDAALLRIAQQTSNLDAIIVVGAPVKCEDYLYNCAVVIQKGELLAIVPKIYLKDYDAFSESRWFIRPSRFEPSEIKIGDKSARFGFDFAFCIGDVTISVEISEDLYVPVASSSERAMTGANILVNIAAINDVVGSYSYLKSLVVNQSAKCISAYVFVGAGYGESSTDLVFDGKAIIAEKGNILAEAERWTGKPSITLSDIDIEAIKQDRLRNNTYIECAKRDFVPRPTIDCEPQKKNDSCSTLIRKISPTPFVPSTDSEIAERCEEIVNIQVAGLAQRLDVTNTRTLVIGVSGGLDSTLALLVAARTFDRLGISREGIVGVTMPGFGTTDRTYNNAITLMKSLGITIREIPIAEAVGVHFRDIGHDPNVTDVTYENSQARERTQILMDIANQVGGMVLGTGDLSELALGWATYNGDHMSMYGVNAGVPKTLVRHMVRHFVAYAKSDEEKAALLDVVDTPISPELIPADSDGNIAQKTEDLVGPYELHDFFIYYTMRYGFTPRRILFMAKHAFTDYDDATIKHWMKVFYRRFFNQQFKRSCLPDGPKVGTVGLSPRGDWKMPSDASSALWLREIDSL